MRIFIILPVWADLAAASSFSPLALEITEPFIFWLMNIESICSAPEATGIRNRPISLQPLACQTFQLGIWPRLMPRKEKLMDETPMTASRMEASVSCRAYSDFLALL